MSACSAGGPAGVEGAYRCHSLTWRHCGARSPAGGPSAGVDIGDLDTEVREGDLGGRRLRARGETGGSWQSRGEAGGKERKHRKFQQAA